MRSTNLHVFPTICYALANLIVYSSCREIGKCSSKWNFSANSKSCCHSHHVGFGNTHLKRSEEHTSELQSRFDLVCRLLLEKKKTSVPENHKCLNLAVVTSA